MEDELSRPGPEFVRKVEDKSIGLEGYVVVDRSIAGHFSGGFGIHPK